MCSGRGVGAVPPERTQELSRGDCCTKIACVSTLYIFLVEPTRLNEKKKKKLPVCTRH